MNENCIFCKLANHVFDTNIVYEDDICTVFLDNNPISIGHCLVVSKEHYESILEVPNEVVGKLMIVAQKVAKGLMKLPGVKGINIFNNCQETAGQAVMHVHIHVVPRYTKDELQFAQQNHYELSNDEFKKIKEDIIKTL